MNVIWYPYHHSPRETCTRGTLLSFEKKKEEKRGGWNLDGSLINLCKGKCNTRLPATHKQICTLTKSCETLIFIYVHGISARLCTKVYMPFRQTCTKEVAGQPDNRALWVK